MGSGKWTHMRAGSSGGREGGRAVDGRTRNDRITNKRFPWTPIIHLT